MSNVIVSQPTKDELTELGIAGWDKWECQPSKFDWSYSQQEWCYLFEGVARINTPEGLVEIRKGDLVKFPKGLQCVWEVLEKVSKVYIFL